MLELNISEIQAKAVANILKKYSEKLRKQLKMDNHYATGETDKSIKVKITQGAVSIVGSKSIQNLTIGTPPQSQSNLYLDIIRWAGAKKIQTKNIKQFALLVTKKLQKYGYKIPNTYNDGQSLAKAINMKDLQKEFEDACGRETALAVQNKIIKNIKK